MYKLSIYDEKDRLIRIEYADMSTLVYDIALWNRKGCRVKFEEVVEDVE